MGLFKNLIIIDLNSIVYDITHEIQYNHFILYHIQGYFLQISKGVSAKLKITFFEINKPLNNKKFTKKHNNINKK